MGPDTYDLVSLLRDSYVDLPEQTVGELIAYFLALKGATGDRSATSAQRFDLMALQRNLKALGTFGYQTTARRNPVYIQYIPRTLRYVRDNLEAPAAVRPAARAARDARRGVPVGRRSTTRALDAVGALGPRSDRRMRTIRGYRPPVSPCRVACVSGFPRTSITTGGSSGAPGADRRLRLRGDRAVRDAQPLRLPRRRRRSTQLADWLAETGLALHSVHAPITRAFGAGDRWAPTFSNAVSRRRPARRRRCARRKRRCRSPSGFRSTSWSCTSARRRRKNGAGRQPPRGGRCAASRRSAALAEPLGVRVALEVIPNALSDAGVAGRDARARPRVARTPASASTSATRT